MLAMHDFTFCVVHHFGLAKPLRQSQFQNAIAQKFYALNAGKEGGRQLL